MRISRPILFLAALLAVLVIAPGCGGDDPTGPGTILVFGDGDKTMRFGRNVQETLQLEDNLGDACEAYLRGRFSMEPVVE